MRTIATVTRRLGEWLWRIGDRTVKVRYAGLAICLVVFALILVQFQIDHINDRNRREDERTAARDLYEVELNAYQAQLAQYESCLTRVQTRLDSRDVFVYMTTLQGVAGTEAAIAFLAYLDEKLPALDPAECVVPVAPQFPDD